MMFCIHRGSLAVIITTSSLMLVLAASEASASSFTRNSPAGGALPAGVTEVGGVVLDLIGANGARVVTEAAASSLYIGSPAASVNPLLFGSQPGFTPSVLAALGGGLSKVSARISLYDGDSAPGDFDFNDNTLFIGTSFSAAAAFGNFSSVSTEQTTSTGTTINSGTGFGNNILSTGFFSSSELAKFYSNIVSASVGGGILNFYLLDKDPGDQFYDFTRGIDGSLVNVGTGPIVTPPPLPGVPLPASLPMFGAALLAFGAVGYGVKRKRLAIQI